MVAVIQAPAHRTQRERDASDLQTFARLLELGVNPNNWALYVIEPWPVILRRYLADEYARADKSSLHERIARHFWLRQALHDEKQDPTTAAFVAEAFKKAAIIDLKASTVLDIAKTNRVVARQWIAYSLRQYRAEFTRDSILRSLVAHFEPEVKL